MDADGDKQGTEGRSISDLAEQAAALLQQRFQLAPTTMVAAPGRVNLIGEHVDYNDGLVLPMAIDRYVVIAAALASRAGGARVYSAALDETARLELAGEITPGPVTWASYVQGVIAEFIALGHSLPAFDAIVVSDVPLGGGLSSSAALEVANATLLEQFTGHRLDPVQKALLCQAAEQKFAGVPCGIMDQFSSTLCEQDAMLLLDCRSREVQQIPFRDPDLSVVIVNSNVRHDLATSAYAERRAECQQACQVLGVSSLRDVTATQLAQQGGELSAILLRRATHVVTEIQRVASTAQAIQQGDWTTVGELMRASHASLRDEYEVSCTELDLLVALATELGPAAGVLGARMTGGGFGGCTVNLVRSNTLESVTEQIAAHYVRQTGITSSIFATRPVAGARYLELP